MMSAAVLETAPSISKSEISVAPLGICPCGLLSAEFHRIRLRVNKLVVDKAPRPRWVPMNSPKSVSVSQNLVEQIAESNEAVVGDNLHRLDIRESARTWDRWRTAFD